jgi:hypothetical protein
MKIMMKRNLAFIAVLIINSFTIILCQTDPVQKSLQAITKNVLESQLSFLSSNWMEGRRSGEKGEAMASDYIASMLQLYGVKPAGDVSRSRNQSNQQGIPEKTWFQNFYLLKTAPGDEQELKLTSSENGATRVISFMNNVDFSVRPRAGIEIDAPVVFAGYGFKSDRLKFNDFSKLDLKGKFILKLSGVPAFAESALTSEEIFNTRRDLEDFARKQGAAGIIEFNPLTLAFGVTALKDFQNMSSAEINPRPTDIYSSYSIMGDDETDTFIRLTITGRAAKQILNGSGISIEEYIKKADANQPYTLLPLTGKTLSLKTSVVQSVITVRNVIGIIEGKNPDQVIVLGAHYDHMGMNKGYVWNGADDNGSGTVGVMTIARAIMETGIKPDKSIIIALWTAEEEGLLGSEYFVKNLPFPKNNVKLNVNFDMISRYIAEDQPKNVVMTYSETHKEFKDLTVSNLSKYNIDLNVSYQPSANPPGGSDHRSFVAAGLPVMRFKPGHREEYHTPADEIGTIDWDIMEKIVKISFANVWQLANSQW